MYWLAPSLHHGIPEPKGRPHSDLQTLKTLHLQSPTDLTNPPLDSLLFGYDTSLTTTVTLSQGGNTPRAPLTRTYNAPGINPPTTQLTPRPRPLHCIPRHPPIPPPLPHPDPSRPPASPSVSPPPPHPGGLKRMPGSGLCSTFAPTVLAQYTSRAALQTVA